MHPGRVGRRSTVTPLSPCYWKQEAAVTTNHPSTAGRSERMWAISVASLVVAILGLIVPPAVELFGSEIKCKLLQKECDLSVPLTMDDFRDACVGQYREPRAQPTVLRTDYEPASYWIKCVVDRTNMGGVDLDRYCAETHPGTRSHNAKRDAPPTDQPWLHWRCV
jgi:hypothetical protein